MMNKKRKKKIPSDREVFHQVLGMKQQPYRFDHVTIEQLEKGIGRAQISLAFLVTLTFVGIFVLVFSVGKVSFLSIFAGDIENNIVGTQKIMITAEVPNTLGVKRVYEEQKEITYLVYGNNQSGFSFISTENNEILFSYKEMPGDGVLVKIPKGFTDIKIGSYY